MGRAIRIVAASGILVVALGRGGPARAGDDVDADDRPRAELSVGGDLGQLRLRGHTLDPGGVAVLAGVRTHRFAISGDYRALGVKWTADGDASALGVGTGAATGDAEGTLQRLGVNARYNLLTLGSSSAIGSDRIMHEFFEMFVEGGAGVERIDWDGGGEYTRPDLELGGGVRMYGIRIGDDRTVGLLVRVSEFISPRPGPTDPTPTCAGPCTSATPPQSIDRGIMVAFGLVVST